MHHDTLSLQVIRIVMQFAKKIPIDLYCVIKKNTILLLSLIHCNITLMFPFVCAICKSISYAT